MTILCAGFGRQYNDWRSWRRRRHTLLPPRLLLLRRRRHCVAQVVRGATAATTTTSLRGGSGGEDDVRRRVTVTRQHDAVRRRLLQLGVKDVERLGRDVGDVVQVLLRPVDAEKPLGRRRCNTQQHTLCKHLSCHDSERNLHGVPAASTAAVVTANTTYNRRSTSLATARRCRAA